MKNTKSTLKILLAIFSSATLLACKPSSNVTRTTPVANLQSYQTALIRISSIPAMDSYRTYLQYNTSHFLQTQCGFTSVNTEAQVGATSPDLILDLNIQDASRGGTGFIKNENMAVVNVTMVLSDGIDQSLLGSAEIEGKSSAVSIQSSDPEKQAFTEVAKRVADILEKSGCKGARIARKTDQPKQNIDSTVQPETRAEAEALNDEGKQEFRSANFTAAKTKFSDALKIVPDPRYLLNICLAHEALSEFDQAIGACNAVITSTKNDDRVSIKAQKRLEIIKEKRGE